MRVQTTILGVAMSALMLLLSACTNLPRREPVQVYVVGIDPLPGQGLELRMNIKLRVQNPNDTAIDYDGVYVGLNLQGRRFATGVSDTTGSVPRFGESVIEVPVSVSAWQIARQAIDALGPRRDDKVRYEIEGRLSGPVFRSVRFASKGEMVLPAGVYDAE
jgi:LEA14-like dessication related protein